VALWMTRSAPKASALLLTGVAKVLSTHTTVLVLAHLQHTRTGHKKAT
jgi:hypothetical protein